MSAVMACAALFERDILAVAKARSQLYSSMLMPLAFLVFLGVGVSEGLEPSNLSDGNYTAYLVAGVVTMTAVFSSTFSSASYYRDRDTGMLRVFLSSPHSARVVLVGKSLAGVFIGTAQCLVVFGIAAPFVEFEWQYGVFRGLLVALVAVLLLNLFLAGLAQALASRVSTMQGFHLVMNLALFPLLFFSGAFFPVANLPGWLEALAMVNPLSYAVDALVLAAYAGDADEYFGLVVDFAVLGVLAVGVFGLGLAKTPRLTWSGR